MADIFGIDLGTTNSCIAWLEDGVPKVLTIDNGRTVPSVISFEGDDVLVGTRAANRAVVFPEDTVASVKRSMGIEPEIEVAGRALPPEEISSFILRYLKHEGGRAAGRDVTRVVITVPAYFSDVQRRLTREAGEMAGLKVERIINEPTAAALFYDLTLPERERGKEKNVLVYDLGGGTFDVSVLRMGEIIEVQASTGDTALGGDDFDRVIMDKCLEKIRTETKQDLSTHKPALARLRMAAEKAKITLSTKVDVSIEEDLLPVPEGDPVSLRLDISREELESWIAPFLTRTAEEMEKALDEAGVASDDIDQCILVGGSTRIPAVMSVLEEVFGPARLPVVDPDLCVAMGAAVQGGIISGEHCGQVLVDVTAHTLGTKALTETGAGHELRVVPIIPRNTQIPVFRASRFATMYENQKRIVCSVFQGESSLPEECTLIGELDLQLVPAPENCPLIIEYGYDLDGIIHVRVEQQGYGRIREVDFSAHKQGQSALEVDFMDTGDLEDEDVIDIDVEDSAEKEKDTSQVTNFILQKGRKLAETLTGEERQIIDGLLAAYADALTSGEEDLVDDTEEALVDFMDEIEE
ncbi:MAG TPA: Hsp70 family protein [Desulfomicrobiaceae bacterium]|nr:Hsp70 family protein [Desulfomicrobiaceae bacterium]